MFPDAISKRLQGDMSRFPGGGAVTVISSESPTFRFVVFLEGVGEISIFGFVTSVDVLLSPGVLGWCVISSIRCI